MKKGYRSRDSIQLSEEHGVNPSLEQCFVCGESKGVVLFGQISNKRAEALNDAGLSTGWSSRDNDHAAPRQVCMDQEPCNECKKHMKMGIILISVDEEKSGKDMQNPYRTGGWVVVTEDFIKRTFNPPELVEDVLKRRMAFMPDEAWDMIGLPRGNKSSDGTTNEEDPKSHPPSGTDG